MTQLRVARAGAICEITRPTAPGAVVIVRELFLMKGLSKSVTSTIWPVVPNVLMKSCMAPIPDEKLDTPIRVTSIGMKSGATVF